MPTLKLSNTLKELRQKQCLTQAEVADYLNISRAAYSIYESGQRMPSIEIIKKISDFFHISINDLLGYNDIPNLSRTKRLSQSPKEISDEKAMTIICELLDYAGLDFALTTDEIKRITKITRELHKALINDIKENTNDIII